MRKLLHALKSDESLMLAYQQGDAVAFEVLYQRHKDVLFAFLYRSCPQPAVVEELAQEAWMSIIRRAENYQPTAKFKTYLFQVAHHKLVDHWRRTKHSARDQNIDEWVSDEQGFENNNPDLDEALGDSRIRDQLTQAILQLPMDQRDVFLLREEGFSQAQIAEIVGAGSETVKSRLRYAGKRLKSLLENSFEEVGHEFSQRKTGVKQ